MRAIMKVMMLKTQTMTSASGIHLSDHLVRASPHSLRKSKLERSDLSAMALPPEIFFDS
jgi:hypothetical protein